MKNLIYCPDCMSLGIKSVLGEIKNDGIEVLRFHNGVTRIKSSNYQVVCGKCGGVVMVRSHSHTSRKMI